MGENGNTDHNDHLQEQLDRSRKTYLRMREAGYDKQRKISLRFAYRPTDMDHAFDLAGKLREGTRYDVEAMEVKEGWVVRGTTKPVRIDAATLGKWIFWMCASGYRHECYFDGWGARIDGE